MAAPADAPALSRRQAVGLPTVEKAGPARRRRRRRARRQAAALHLVRRTTYGPTPATVRWVRKNGPDAWLDQQLDPARVKDPEGDDVRRLYPELGWSIADVHAQVKAGRMTEFSWDVMFALGQATIALRTWSRRQLYEAMCELWSDHLHVPNPFDGGWDTRQDYDRQVIRRHALGRFDRMLVASATHPAMMRYLNLADSTKAAPNENYGRELLELHTVGVGAGYTQAHVVSSARILTGYKVDWRTGQPSYDPTDHWTGPVAVLGFRAGNHKADGRAVAADYLRYLAHHPRTARRIATKLATRFVSDDPSPQLVKAVARAYRKNDTAIVPALRVLFSSKEFRRSKGVKLRRPLEDLTATLRALDARLLPASRSRAQRRRGPEALYWISQEMQQAPMAWAPPNGYPDVAPAWASGDVLLSRWNVHMNLAGRWWPGTDRLAIPEPAAQLPDPLPATWAALIDALAVRLTGARLSAGHRQAVLTFVGHRAADPVDKGRDPGGWLSWSLPRLLAIVLDTPQHLFR